MAALLFLTLAWGYTWILAKIALREVAPFAFAAQRSLAGAVCLFIALPLMGRSLRLRGWRKTLIIGAIQTALFFILQTWTLVESGPGKTAVLIYTMPIWTLFLGRLILGERIAKTQWVAATITLVGLLCIIEPWNFHGGKLAIALGVLAAGSWAWGTVLVKQWRSELNGDLLVFTAWQMMFGAILLCGIAWIVPEPATQWTTHYLLILAALGIVSNAICWFLWLYVLEHLPAWQASLSILGVPVVALLSSRLQLDEQLAVVELIGVALIGCGLLLLSLINWSRSRHEADPKADPKAAPRPDQLSR
ncbi:MAG: EamA family transporter [Rhodocyclaceae bacterium]|nr:EamA family transporter [Rhodocyclaceae bacterium]